MDKKSFIGGIIRASIFAIVKTEEISNFIEDDMFKSECDTNTDDDNKITFMPHRFNEACLIHNLYGTFKCQIFDNVRINNDNTKHQLMPLPNDYLFACLRILQLIDLK